MNTLDKILLFLWTVSVTTVLSIISIKLRAGGPDWLYILWIFWFSLPLWYFLLRLAIRKILKK